MQMRRWESWEQETRTMEYQVENGMPHKVQVEKKKSTNKSWAEFSKELNQTLDMFLLNLKYVLFFG